MKKLIAFLTLEAGQVVAGLFCLAIIFWLYGCESKVMSLHNNGKLVNRAQIQLELDTFMTLAEIRYNHLDRQDAFKRALFDAALLTAQSGTINPYGVIATLLSALGIGATVDNVRKRVEIKKLNHK